MGIALDLLQETNPGVDHVEAELKPSAAPILNGTNVAAFGRH